MVLSLALVPAALLTLAAGTDGSGIFTIQLANRLFMPVVYR
jgi:hypothetical protein